MGCLASTFYGLEEALNQPPAGPEPGAVFFGSWQILRLAGEGAFGLVYEATQEEPMRRRAALKMLKPGLDSREIMTRFATERAALALLDHPGIARVLDAGTEDGRPWFAAEWVDGALPVTTYAADHNLSLPQRAVLFQQICEAIAHAHLRGIIHRDLKPSNLLVNAAGQAKVIDFGIARATEEVLAHSTLVTMAGQVLGTPAYMSPEQADGRSGEVDLRSDIYSLGAVLYEVLTDRPPFPSVPAESRSLHEVLRMIHDETPARPSSLNPALRGELEWILRKALEKDPARRYETAAALGRDLAAWQSGGTLLAAPPSRAYQLKIFLRRHRAASLGAAAFLLALLAGLAGTTTMFLRAKKQEAATEANRIRATAGEAAARRNDSAGNYQTARNFLLDGESAIGVRYLARAVLADPANPAPAERLMAELAWTDFPRLAHPPATLPEFIRFVGFSPDATRLAVLGNDINFAPGILTLINPDSGLVIGPPIPGCHGFSFSPDSMTLAIGRANGDVAFLQSINGQPAPSPILPAMAHPVRDVTWITANRLATVEDIGEKSSIGRLWDLTTGTCLTTTPSLQSLGHPAISRDASRLAWTACDGRVTVLDSTSGAEIAHWQTPSAGLAAFAGSPSLLAVQNVATKLQLYRLPEGQPLGEAMQSSTAPYEPVPSPDGRWIITTGFDGMATQWDVSRQTPARHFPGSLLKAVFTSDGSLLALGGHLQENVLLQDMDRQRPARAALPIPGAADALALSVDGRWLACGGRHRQLRIYDLLSRAARPGLRLCPPSVRHLSWNTAGTVLTVDTATGGALSWDQDGLPVEPFPKPRSSPPPVPAPDTFPGWTTPPTPIRQWLLSPDQRTWASSHLDGTARLWDARSGQPASPVLAHESMAGPDGLTLQFSPDSTQLATAGSHDNRARLWSVPSGAPIARLPHPSHVHSLAFAPGGHRIATLCTPNTGPQFRYWDIDNESLLIPPCLVPCGRDYQFIAMHPDGTRAALAGASPLVLIYDLPPELTHAPTWLVPLAQWHTAWPDDPARPTLSPLEPDTAFPPNTDPAVRRWQQWFYSPADTRSTSPLSNQSRQEYCAILRRTGLLQAYQEINQYHPSLPDALQLKARTLLSPVPQR